MESQPISFRGMDLSSHPECITFIHCKDCHKNIIIYAFGDRELGHYGVFELAVDQELIDEEVDIIGGGHLRYSTLEYECDSQAFGPADNEIVTALQERISTIKSRRGKEYDQ